MAYVLSERIAELRRERGLTQEQLGQLVGVSAQAVSKWEKGGAPDVELLPALADRLGVSIDALFGREGGETVDVHKVLGRWVASIPDEQRLNRICRLLWGLFGDILSNKVEMPKIEYLDHGSQLLENESGRLESTLLLSQVRLDSGIMLDLHARDFSFATIWPEPEAGYAAFFAPKEKYRRLFALLAKPGCLDMLEHMYRQKRHYCIPNAVAISTGLPCEQVEALMAELTELSLLEAVELELETGLVKAYANFEGVAFVPFFYMARSLMQGGSNLIYMFDRDAPILRGAAWKETEED